MNTSVGCSSGCAYTLGATAIPLSRSDPESSTDDAATKSDAGVDIKFILARCMAW